RPLARVDRHDAVAVALQVEAHEVARAQLVGREPDDGDGLRGVQDPEDRERILPALRDLRNHAHWRTLTRAPSAPRPPSAPWPGPRFGLLRFRAPPRGGS